MQLYQALHSSETTVLKLGRGRIGNGTSNEQLRLSCGQRYPSRCHPQVDKPVNIYKVYITCTTVRSYTTCFTVCARASSNLICFAQFRCSR